MARPSKAYSWRPTESLRIRAWYRALLGRAIPDEARRDRNGDFRAAELQRVLAEHGIEVSSSRLTDWKLGRCLPSKGRLLSLRRMSPEIGLCEELLTQPAVILENRLAKLFLVLDVAASNQQMRLQCLDLIPKLAAPWLPQPEMTGCAAFGWRIDRLGVRGVDAVIAHKANPLDPLSQLDCCMHTAGHYLAPHVISMSEAKSEEGQRWEALAEDWAFDVLCISLLINRLISRELSHADGNRVSASAEAASVLRKILLSEIPTLASPQLSRIFENAGMPSGQDFVLLIAMCARLVESAITSAGVHLNEVRGLIEEMWRPIGLSDKQPKELRDS